MSVSQCGVPGCAARGGEGLTKFRLMRPCRVDTTTVAGTLGVPGGGIAGDSATMARSRLIAPWRVRKEALMSEVPRPSLPQARLRFLRCLRSVLGTGPSDGSVGSMRYVPIRSRGKQERDAMGTEYVHTFDGNVL